METELEKELILQHGRPADCGGRTERETAVYDLLDSLQIEYDRVDHEAAFTMEACEAPQSAKTFSCAMRRKQNSTC